MLRRETEQGWVLISQHDHARLSYKLMSAWNFESFYRPSELDEVLFALQEHDSGWKEWDASPKINQNNRFPADFTEMEPFEQSDIWRRCIESFEGSHPYASALIALHFSLFNERNLKKAPENLQSLKMRAEMNDLVRRILGVEFDGLELAKLPDPLRSDMRMLQIGDMLSLAICLGRSDYSVDDVPCNNRGSNPGNDPRKSSLILMSSSDRIHYTFRPYPFVPPEIELSVEGRLLDKRTFDDHAELRDCIESSPRISLELTVSQDTSNANT